MVDNVTTVFIISYGLTILILCFVAFFIWRSSKIERPLKQTFLLGIMAFFFTTSCYFINSSFSILINMANKYVSDIGISDGGFVANEKVEGSGNSVCGDDRPTIIAGWHGSVPGYYGSDYSCPDREYAPINGTVTYSGCDKYVGAFASTNASNIYNPCGQENTHLIISGSGSNNGDVVELLHGCWDIDVGEQVIRGVTPIGRTCANGNIKNNVAHTHMVYRKAGVNVASDDLLKYEARVVMGKSDVQYSEVTNFLKLRGVSDGLVDGEEQILGMASHYDVNQGGTNCAYPCGITASGEKVSSWWNDGMACPAEWPFGTKVMVGDDGRVFTCIDRGGFINCIDKGERDKAVAHQHSKGYYLDVPVIAEQDYCWFDALIEGNVGLAPYMSHIDIAIVEWGNPSDESWRR